jgi:hypothetical protein
MKEMAMFSILYLMRRELSLIMTCREGEGGISFVEMASIYLDFLKWIGKP